MGIARSLFLWASQNRWLEHQFKRRRFAKRAVSRFVPGETADDALDESGRLAGQSITSVLTRLGENVTSAEEAEEVTEHYLGVLDNIQARGLNTHVSVKLTQFGLDFDTAATAERLDRLTEAAAARGNVIWVDMEASNYVDVTLEIYRAARAKRENVGLCIQAYLHRTPADIETLLGEGAAIRLVKGAYQEPADVAIPRKRDVDEAFYNLSLRLIEHATGGVAVKPGIATHDTTLIERLHGTVQTRGWPRDAYEVQMLYGIRRPEQQRLAQNGVPMRVLISYGAAWFPWYMRRLAERPANVGFVIRSMFAR